MASDSPVQPTFQAPARAEPDRQRKSFYLDRRVAEHLDAAYRDFNHRLYPDEITKSLFLETLIEFGLDNLESLRSRLSSAA